MDKEEIWKDIPRYKGFYQASSLGRIRRLFGVVIRSDGNTRTIPERTLSQSNHNAGYMIVGLSIDGINKYHLVHQLVAMAFLNHKPESRDIVVDHINTIKTDNRVENLQIISFRENCSKDKKGCASKYTGVYFVKKTKRWRSNIYSNGKSIYLGTFATEIEASNAYQNKLNQLRQVNN